MKTTAEKKQNKTKKTFLHFSLFNLSAILLGGFALFLVQCNTTEPPPVIPPQPKPVGITLKLITKSSTEVFLTASAKDTLLPAAVKIKRDNVEIMSFYLTKADTTVIDTGLAAGRTYNYNPVVELNGKYETGDSLIVTTLDTTSSNFTWQTYTFGNFEAGSSTLNDVAIINENDIWAVGAIYMNDSTGQADPNAYNTVHWNGNDWELIQLQFYTFCGQPNTGSYPAKSIIAFSSNNILITSGSQITHFDGINQLGIDCIPVSVNKLWGKNGNNLFAVGQVGNIAHYNGTSWTKIESGTTTNLNDVWGYFDKENNKSKVLAVVSNMYDIGEHRLLSVTGGQAQDTLNYPYNTRLKGVWFRDKNSPVYICGSGIREYKRGTWKLVATTGWVIKGIRGSDVNNIVAVDDNGVLLHYNGINWQKDEQLKGQYIPQSIAIKNNTVVIVGENRNGIIGNSAVIVVGKR